MKSPVFLDWNNSGSIDPADIATSYGLSEGECDDEPLDDDTPRKASAGTGCMTAVALIMIAPVASIVTALLP